MGRMRWLMGSCSRFNGWWISQDNLPGLLLGECQPVPASQPVQSTPAKAGAPAGKQQALHEAALYLTKVLAARTSAEVEPQPTPSGVTLLLLLLLLLVD